MICPSHLTLPQGEGYSRKADIWSVGCVALEMISGQAPHADLVASSPDRNCMLFNIARNRRKYAATVSSLIVTHCRPPVPPSIGTEASTFLHQCFKLDPRERSTAAQLLTHRFVAKNIRHAGPLCPCGCMSPS